MSERPESLIATALRHGLRADVSIEEAAGEILRMANGDHERIEQALSRIDGGHARPPGLVGEYARQALRLALKWSLHPSMTVGARG